MLIRACLLDPLLFIPLSFFKKESTPLSGKKRPVVIVVGNLTVGGAGKTPTVLWLTETLKGYGLSVGIISRGYGRKNNAPQVVFSHSDAREVGDEPLLMAKRLHVPVVVAKKRQAALETLLMLHPDLDVVLSDDGLTHYALARDLEILVIDGKQRFGNGYLLPAGPLRAPLSLKQSIPFRLCLNGLPQAGEYAGHFQPICFRNVKKPEKTMTLDVFRNQTCYAVAGIAIPEKFFNSLKALGIICLERVFPDHHLFSEADFQDYQNHPILMTEKDAVKCRELALNQAWFLEINLEVDPVLIEKIVQKIGTAHG